MLEPRIPEGETTMAPKWAIEIIHTCLNVREGEKFLLIADESLAGQADILAAEARGVNPAWVQTQVIPDSQRPLTAFPDALKQPVSEADVVLLMLATLDPGREQPALMQMRPLINHGRTRAVLTGLATKDVLDNELSADYQQIAATTLHVAGQLQGVSAIRVATDSGTDLSMQVAGRRWLTDTGLSRGPGIGNLPAGEVFIAPLEDSANGELVIDGSIFMTRVDAPVRVTFENGHALSIEGDETARMLESLLAVSEGHPGSEWARVIGEFGIGTNDRARLRGNIFVDEKVMGTIHVAIGRNDMFGGQNTAAMHVDAVVTRPTVWVDDRMIIQAGKLLVVD
jgi:leucyl aminopeptidase (aminopeptidase T)